MLGNGTASGTTGNKRGWLLLYGLQSYYAEITTADTMTANRTIRFPDANGTVSLDGHTHFKIVTEGDNRKVATIPNDYSAEIRFRGLKEKATINDSTDTPISSSYAYLIGLRGWHDSSGGNAHELAFSNDSILHRNGATTSWGAWRPIAEYVLANGYWGLVVNGSTSDWIRTTTNGIIPVQSGAAGSGHSSLGTSSWYFSKAYIDTVYGSLNGKIIGKSYNEYAPNSTNTNIHRLLFYQSNLATTSGSVGSDEYCTYDTIQGVLKAPAFQSGVINVSDIYASGNLIFSAAGTSAYPSAAKGIKWSGGTDAIDMYYNLRASDSGELIINMKDDSNVRVSFAYNGTVKSYIDTNGNFSGNASTATKSKVVYDVDASSWDDTIGIGYKGAGLTASEATYVACYTSKAMTQTGAGTHHIKDLSFANLKTKIGFEYSTLFSGTAAASITMTSMSGYTRLVVFCKNTSNTSFFTVQLEAVTGYHYHIMAVTPTPSGAQSNNKFYGLLFNLSSATALSVSAGKYSTLSSSAALETGPTIHITKVIGYKF